MLSEKSIDGSYKALVLTHPYRILSGFDMDGKLLRSGRLAKSTPENEVYERLNNINEITFQRNIFFNTLVQDCPGSQSSHSSVDTDFEYEVNPSHELFKSKLRKVQEAAVSLNLEIPFTWRSQTFNVSPDEEKFTPELLESKLISALSGLKDLTESEQKVLYLFWFVIYL